MKEYGKMKELSFESDYIEGAHEKILKRLLDTNMEQVYFLVGGTQTNMILIDTMLESYEGVVAAKRYGEEKV